MSAHAPASRLSHAELPSPHEMAGDCRAAGVNLARLERAAQAAVGPAPSMRFEDYPSEVGKPGIEVSDAAARLASALHLHLD